MLRELLVPDKKIAVLAGAGISLDPPANLLDGWTFMFEVLRRAAPSEVDRFLSWPSSDLKRQDTWKKSWVLSILDLPDSPFGRPGELLRFEVLMSELAQSGLDPKLQVLNCLNDCDRPNRNHFVLAELIRSGHVVITTNFDRLIEVAYARLNDGSPPLRVVYRDGDFPPALPSAGIEPTLWKIHGSLSVNGEDTRESVQATMMSILATELTVRKKMFLESLLAAYDLWVVGYSGWDDLDIIPTLANAPSQQRLIWIDHKDHDEPTIKNASELNQETLAHWEIDSVGRDRIRFTETGGGAKIRDPEKVLIVSVHTSRAMDALVGTYVKRSLSDPGNAEFEFGQRFPRQVENYFDDWRTNLRAGRSAPYEFVADIFGNRANARAEIRNRVRNIRQTIEDLRAHPMATPYEKLQALIARFNDLEKPRPQASLEPIRNQLQALIRSLPPELEGTALRLLACISWELEGPSAGADLFQKAVAIDREAGRVNEEFHTLTTWRDFNGYSQWDDLLADEWSEEIRGLVSADYLRRIKQESDYVGKLSANRLFPEEETQRIHELARKNGHFPVLWAQAVRTTYNVIDDDPQVLLVLHDRNRRVKRFCVDLGDVLGEAQTTLTSARMYAIDHEYQIAIEESLRVIELNRILDQPELTFEATRNLGYCRGQIGDNYEQRIWPVLQDSMWRRKPEEVRDRVRLLAPLRWLARIPARLSQLRGKGLPTII